MLTNQPFFYKLGYDMVAAKMEYFIGTRPYIVNRYSSKGVRCQSAGRFYTRLIGLIGLIRSIGSVSSQPIQPMKQIKRI
jgi:hypothetical protein